MKKRLLSILLALVMALSLLPTAALAEEVPPENDTNTISVTIYTKTDGTPATTEQKLNVNEMKANTHTLDVKKPYTTDPGVLFELDPEGSEWEVDNKDTDDGICRLVAFKAGTLETDVKAFLKNLATPTDVDIDGSPFSNGALAYDTVFYQESDDYDHGNGKKWEWVNSGSDNKWKNNQALFGDVIFTSDGSEGKIEPAYTLNYDANGGTGAPASQTGSSSTGSYPFTVSNTKPTRGDLHFMGWADSANATTANYQPGISTITLYQANPTKTIYAVWGGHEDADGDGLCDNGRECLHQHVNGYCTEENCDHPHGDNGCCPLKPQQPTVPGVPSDYDKLKELLGNEIVKIDCTNTEIDPQHLDGTYGLLTGSYTVGDVTGTDTEGYTCTVTINAEKYIEQYNTDTKVTHTLNGGETNPKTITLKGSPNPDGTNWIWEVATELPVTFNVVCETPEEKPEAPTDLSRILTGNFVTVECISTNTHDKKSLSYGLLPGGYTIGGVEGDAANGYTCKVTFDASAYQAEYNKDTNSKHELDPKEQKDENASVVLQWVDGAWIVPAGAKVKFTVICETPEEKPEAPTDLSNILAGNFVTVECISTNGHSDKSLSYGLLEGGYTIGGVEGDAANGYTCKVTIYADVYQAAYNTSTDSKHELEPKEQPVSIVLYWVKETGWTAPDRYAPCFTVTCDGDSSYYTVTYTDGVDGVVVFADQTYYVPAGSQTPAFVGALTRAGYTFTGWTPEWSATVMGSVTYTAQWRRSYHYTASTEAKPTLNKADHYAYVVGYPDGTVQPQGAITRAEVATIFFRLLSDETRDLYWTKDNGYTDVKAGDWFNNAVSTLSNAGIINGYPDGTFRPNAPITRAEMAKVIAMFAELDKDSEGFKDIAGHWAEAYIKLAAGNGWIAGYPDGTFRPDQYITRAETMTMINRVLERVPSTEKHLLSHRVMLTFPDNQPGDWYYIAVQEATNSHTYERYATEKNGDEQWIKLIDNYDWTKLEF